MKKLKYIILLSIIIFASCDDNLEVENPNAQASNTYWNTQDDIASGVIAIYNKLLVDGSYLRAGVMLQDLVADDVVGNSADPLYPTSGSFTVTASYAGIYWPWRDFFAMAYRANLVIEKAEGITFEDDDYKDRLLGQTYFLRAFAYYELTEFYCDVPLILSVPTTSEEYYPTESSREEIIAQIESDLNDAMDLLPKTYVGTLGDDDGQLGRATWGAAAALLSRVYMMEYKWDEAGTLLKSIIDSDLYDLVADYGDNFTEENENNEESIWEVQFGYYGSTNNWVNYSDADWMQGNAITMGYGSSSFGGWEDAEANDWIYDEYKKERTEDSLLDPRLFWSLLTYEEEYDSVEAYGDEISNTVYYNESPFFETYEENATTGKIDTVSPLLDSNVVLIAKYTRARLNTCASESEDGYTTSPINYRVIRYAEVLMNYAEVLIVQGKHSAALPYINMIRERAGLSTLALTDADEIEKEYMHQRILEFAVEGIRGKDIKRWGWFYDLSKMEMLGNHDEEFDTWTQGKEYYPINADELSTNPNLVGNSNNNAESNVDDYSDAYDWSSITE